MLEKVRALVKNKLLVETKQKEKDKLEIITKIIADDNCFFQIDVDTALSILIDIGFPKPEALEIYKQLISSKNYNKKGS